MKKVFLIIALLVTLIPVIFVIDKVGGWQNWHGVLPKGTTDSLYYYARIHEVLDGHLLIGNPYVYEYKEAFSPAFFLPDVLSALPALLDIPFNVAVVINIFLWSFIFLLLCFKLLRLFGLPNIMAISWSVLAFITCYSFILRPTIMQIVYPVFLVFLISLIKFLNEPHEKKTIALLSLSAASTFYIYSYLSYIVFITFVFIFFWFLFKRRFEELRALLIAGAFTALLLIPFGIYTLLQMSSPYYFETLNRIGLVYTHTPSLESFFYGRWIVVGLIAFGILWFFFPKNKEGALGQKIFWLSTGTALFTALFLNVITGAELTLGVHVGRFVVLWMTIILGVLLYEGYLSLSTNLNYRKYLIASAVLILVLSVGVARNITRGFDFFKFDNRGDKIADIQVYRAPLNWLEENITEESVIWANDSVSQYIPINTIHYPLFFGGAVLHNISNKELEDRYLLSRSFQKLTLEDLKRDFGLYSGAGPSKDKPRIQNWQSEICKKIAYLDKNRKCLPQTDAITLRGQEYFNDMLKRSEIIKKNQKGLLQQFNVSYLVIDRIRDNLSRPDMSKALYDDGRFVILPIPF